MNRPRVLFTLVAVVVFSALCIGRDSLTAQVKAVPVATTEWEYKLMDDHAVLELGPKEGQPSFGHRLEAGLNKLGAEGWELITVSKPGPDLIYFLKRPKAAR
jgi:hypothetical protein